MSEAKYVNDIPVIYVTGADNLKDGIEFAEQALSDLLEWRNPLREPQYPRSVLTRLANAAIQVLNSRTDEGYTNDGCIVISEEDSNAIKHRYPDCENNINYELNRVKHYGMPSFILGLSYAHFVIESQIAKNGPSQSDGVRLFRAYSDTVAVFSGDISHMSDAVTSEFCEGIGLLLTDKYVPDSVKANSVASLRSLMVMLDDDNCSIEVETFVCRIRELIDGFGY